MKLQHLLILISLSLTQLACSTIDSQQPVDVQATKPEQPAPKQATPPIIPPACPAPNKDPLNVSFYEAGEKPIQPYVVLGQRSISKYNQVGIKRQKASIHDMMREIAASMGGDAIINLKYDKKIVTGTIVSYNKKLA